MIRFFLFAAALCLPAARAQSGTTLLENHPLQGSTRSTTWTSLSSVNPSRYADNPWMMTGTLAVALPGYAAGGGLYSWTGPYSITVAQSTADFDIHHAVVQLDTVWDPATNFPTGAGPLLNYNGGNQRLTPMPMLIGRSRETENNTGIPDMEHLDSFVYRGVTWQWDLSQIEGDVNSVSIVIPLANHSSVVGARIDVASEFLAIGGTTLDALSLWRDTYFSTTANAGDAADGADPDGDGLVNLVEYALGTRPDSTEGDQGRVATPVLAAGGDRLQLSFSIPVSPPAGLTYRVRASSDLGIWTTLASKTGTAAWLWAGQGASRLTTSATAERQQITVGDQVLKSANARRFMRLEVTR